MDILNQAVKEPTLFIQSDKTLSEIDYKPENVDGWLVKGDLATKIKANYPYFDFVKDADGKLTDITPTAKPLEPMKSAKIAQSKTALADYLASHPLLYTDGKHYSVTAEKQNLLNNAIMVYQIAKTKGQCAVLRWNSTGEECTEWTEENITALALAIAAYVAPLVSRQQEIEILINACKTAEELEAITIDF